MPAAKYPSQDMSLLSSSVAEPAVLSPDNPFQAPSTLPFAAPPFDRIADEHYLPAIEAGMAAQRAEIEAIAASPEPPTFANTLVPMETSGQLLTRVLSAFSAVAGANTNDTLQAIKTTVAPLLSAHHDSIYLNQQLFARVSAIYNARESLGLDPESLRLIDIYYDGFVHSGANLSDPDKDRLRQLNEEASTLSTEFLLKVLAAAKESVFTTTDLAALDGLSEAQLASAAELAKSRGLEGWALPIQNTTQQDFFDTLTNRETRRTLFELSWNRTQPGSPNDTTAIISRLAQLRAERARLLGFPSYAAWKLHDQMAKTPEAALSS